MKKRGEERRDLPFLLFLLLFWKCLDRSCRWKMYGESVWSDNWNGNLWEKGCHKRKGARFLISQHIRPCYGPMQPMDNPDSALKRGNQTNLPLGQKVRVFGAAPLLKSVVGQWQWDSV